jgi:hypothetical protein
MPAGRSTIESLQVSKGNAFGFTLRPGDDELSLHPLCLGYPKPARPSRGRISATRALITPYGV